MSYQLNRQSFNLIFRYSDWKFSTKVLSVLFLVIVVSIGSLSLYNYFALMSNAKEAKGNELVNYGQLSSQRAGDVIVGSIKSLQALALAPGLIELAEKANQAYSSMDQSQIQAMITNRDEAWKSSAPSAEALVHSIAGNQVSAQLNSFRNTFPEEVEIFATDIQGTNIAMTDRTSDYWQADEGWWQGAFDNGQGAVYVSEVDYDDSAGTWAVDIGVPIRNAKGTKVIGVLPRHS